MPETGASLSRIVLLPGCLIAAQTEASAPSWTLSNIGDRAVMPHGGTTKHVKRDYGAEIYTFHRF